MKKLCLLLLCFVKSYAQEGFYFDTNKKVIHIPFKLINNLMVIKVEINGVPLNFLLDSGVEKTILFTLEETDSIKFIHTKKIKVRGLGEDEPIDALHSQDNIIKINDFVDKNHDVFIILDQDVNFSSQLGINVHGIIGYTFFKNYLININYNSKMIKIYKESHSFSNKKLNRYEKIPITLINEKPFIETRIKLNNKEIFVKLLIDSGASDAIWLFENSKDIQVPKNYFEDYLGYGFSGNIYGKRARIEKINLGKYEIKESKISFPDTLFIMDKKIKEVRNGSIGAEILKRFNLIFDYPNSLIYLKKNSKFDEPFNYNMSGIEVQHNGLQWVEEKVILNTKLVKNETSSFYTDNNKDKQTVKYNFLLKPIYEVVSVRKDSPAEIVGVKKGDILSKINGGYAYKLKLENIIQIFQSEEGKKINLEVERNGRIIKFEFILKKVL